MFRQIVSRLTIPDSSDMRSTKTHRSVLYAQLVLLATTCFAMACWHSGNDGLWFQGDAPRHAMNGLFWQDFIRDGAPLPAKDYAASYYVRYPVVNPASYPPLFYILEAALFAVFGANVTVARCLVSIFSLTFGCYTLFCLRRWIGPRYGWFAITAVLIPEFVVWSHTIMLNVPSAALQVATLFHGRVWLETEKRAHLFCATVFALLATLTHYTGGISLILLLLWMLQKRGADLRYSRGFWSVSGGLLLLFSVVGASIFAFDRTAFEWIFPNVQDILSARTWLFYPQQMLQRFGWPLCGLATLGTIIGYRRPRWKREVVTWLSCLGGAYFVFTLVEARDIRYIFIAIVPLVCLMAIGLKVLHSQLIKRVGKPNGRRFELTWALAILAIFIALAVRTTVPSVSGFPEVVAYLNKVAPGEALFYDGFYHGIFSWYVRATDSQLERRVVLGNKSLYAFSKYIGYKEEVFAKTPDDVIHLLGNEHGCRWLAIEYGPREGDVPTRVMLRESLKCMPQFELMESFPIKGLNATRIDVYRLNVTIGNVAEVRLPMPTLGKDAFLQAVPIPSRNGSADRLK